jgi:hypothetical protein
MWLLLIAAVTALIGGYIGVDRYILHKGTQRSPAPATAANADKSIAVLPFVDMSEKHDQAYFSDGLADQMYGTRSTSRASGCSSSTRRRGDARMMRPRPSTACAQYRYRRISPPS